MSRDAWNKEYTASGHTHKWDTPWSSPELAGYLAGVGELPATAIDLGCGTGGDAVFLAQQGIETTGLDLSDAALALAQTRAETAGVRVRWVEGNVLNVPFDDESFDLVTDRGCLHHIPHADQPKYAAEVARILRPGGTLLIREMNEAGRHKHAVTLADIELMIDSLPLRVASCINFDMVGPHGSARATLAVIRRLP